MSDHQPLKITRVFDAPLQAVWDAWTKPEEFKKWYMPKPFSVPSCEIDLRPGGKLKADTKDPDGNIMPLYGEFKVVEEPNKLVVTNYPMDEAGNKLFEIQHTVLLSEESGKTTLDLTSEILYVGPDADPFLNGMEEGLNQALDQMSEIV